MGELAATQDERAAFPDRLDGIASGLRALAALGRVEVLRLGLDAFDGLPADAGALPRVLHALADELDAYGQAATAARV